MPTSRLLLLLALLPLTACRRRTADLGMSDSAFVDVMAELKATADAPQLGPALRAQRREGVLRRYKVTAQQLEGLGGELAAHPAHAKRLWQAIEIKANALLARPGTTP